MFEVLIRATYKHLTSQSKTISQVGVVMARMKIGTRFKLVINITLRLRVVVHDR